MHCFISTYIVGEGDEVLAQVVGEERQRFVQASVFVQAGVLRRYQRQVWQL